MCDKPVPAEGFAFADDGLARAADGPVSVSDGFNSAGDGIVPADGDLILTNGGLISADSKPTSADGRPAPADNSFAPADGVPVPANGGLIFADSKPTSADGRPAFTDRPAPADGKPSIADIGPGSADSLAPAAGPAPAGAGPGLTGGFASADGRPAPTDNSFARADGVPVPADGELIFADSKPTSADGRPAFADRPAPADGKPSIAAAGPGSADSLAPAAGPAPVAGRLVPALEPMRERRAGELVYYTFPALEESGLCRHCFTTRLGGVSGGCYSTLNMGPSRGDDPAAVAENYRRVFAALGADLSLAVLSRQTHETNVRAVTGDDAGTGLSRPAFRESVDALITDTPGLVLVTQYADCVPLFFLDPVRPAVGAAHASWRCTLGEIGCLTVRAMVREYGTRPADLLVGIGPSICGRCFEVDPPVVDEFLRRGITEVTRCSSRRGEKYYIDLRELNRLLLIKAGVRPENITVTGLCTKCRPDLFFSHRRTGASRGNLAAIISLKQGGDWSGSTLPP